MHYLSKKLVLVHLDITQHIMNKLIASNLQCASIIDFTQSEKQSNSVTTRQKNKIQRSDFQNFRFFSPPFDFQFLEKDLDFFLRNKVTQ